MTIYHYHPDTKEFLHEGVADPSPLEPGQFLIPAFATSEKPPAAVKGKKAMFVQVDPENIDSGAWEIVTDARGTTVWVKATGEALIVESLGDIPSEQTAIPKPSQFHKWGDGAWALDVPAWLDGEIRPKRDALLNECDAKHCNADKWSDMTAAKKAEWRTYKQALKDLPTTIDPLNPVWPVMPS